MAAEEHIRQLIRKYHEDTISREEYGELLDHFGIDSQSDYVFQLLQEAIENNNAGQSFSKERIDRITTNAHLRLMQRIKRQKPRSFNLRRLIPYAAAVLLLLGGYFLYQIITPRKMNETQLVSRFGDDVPPGANRATVTLPDGTEIPLDEDEAGIISKNEGLSYINGNPIIASKSDGPITVKTPNGGQYFLILPDSTKVWLNSASSITYPANFEGNRREISVKGEVYLEIENGPKKPFVVYSKRQRVNVLGTTLNLKAYEDEPATVTTLISGRIQVSDMESGQQKILEPGQQATSSTFGLEIEYIPQDRLPAWKDGLLVLRDAKFEDVRRELERWYNVEFIGGIPRNSTAVTAILSRNGNLSDVLESMESYTGLKFKIEGRTVMVE